MTGANEYRSYAQECLRWADETDNEEHRHAFLEMAKVWTQLFMHGNGARVMSEPAVGIAANIAKLPEMVRALLRG